MSVLQRNNVHVSRNGLRPMIFAHGFGCDQTVWRLVEPAFAPAYDTILFDHVGSGRSDLSCYSKTKYDTLQGYADDLLEICDELKLKDAIFVGHSVGTMIGALATIKDVNVFSTLILLTPSPCYINKEDFTGGFTREGLESLLETLDRNYLGWSMTMAPVIMANPERPELGEELANYFCRNNPDIMKHFARVTFLADHRGDMPKVQTPTLILQASEDLIAPPSVGEYLHRHIPQNQYVVMHATGHCPHLSAPDETVEAIRGYLN